MKRCRRAGTERELSRVDQRVLRWFLHVERMDEYRVARRALMVEVSEELVRGRPMLGRMGSVKVVLGSRRGVKVDNERQCAKDRKGWKALVHMCMIEFHAAIFIWFLCSLEPPSSVLIAYHLERDGMPLYDAVGANGKKGATTEFQGAGD